MVMSRSIGRGSFAARSSRPPLWESLVRSLGGRGRPLLCAVVVASAAACSSRDAGEESLGKIGSYLPDPGDPPPPPSLTTVTVPEPANLYDFVANKQKAIVLGKALFWEMQIGSDGIQACASCHFHAGADSRARNQTNPDLKRVDSSGAPNPDYDTVHGHNYTLTAADYPFRLLSNPNDRNSSVLRDTNDVAGSQGVTYREFLYVVPGLPIDVTAFAEDPDGFEVAGVNVRRVTPRNGPSVINSVFNFRNFWDGRAQNDFNGVNPFGARDPYARVYQANSPNTQPLAVQISLTNSSLASQAMGPPISSVEMSADGRTWVDIGDKFSKPMRDSGKKLKTLRPLAQQRVHPQDSVLGPYSRSPNDGLTYAKYSDLIHEAFLEKWWNSNWYVKIESDGSRTLCTNCAGQSKTYSIEEMNFSLFFGLAVQLYEATLVSDDAPYDRFQAGDNGALTASQVRGMFLFMSQARGRCINCHAGPEFTNASVGSVSARRFRRREGNLIDMGFNNIGVRPTTEDLALGANDPFGVPLSEARLAVQGLFTDPTNTQPPPSPSDVLGVDGAFKVPSVRNAELTAPYFHNGGTLTLAQVMDFYGRGGDFVPIQSINGQTISPLSTPNLTAQEKEDLVNFVLALTDERVRYRRAPFDHPEITIPHGHPGSNTSVQQDLFQMGQGANRSFTIAEVGANGATPLANFPVP
ncbi:MAG TPA: cytochrome c peroxidase [Polyangiaceae bacterium]|nr:cytochrome c peroxidase [Polyangiaceae bacterium]